MVAVQEGVWVCGCCISWGAWVLHCCVGPAQGAPRPWSVVPSKRWPALLLLNTLPERLARFTATLYRRATARSASSPTAAASSCTSRAPTSIPS